MPGHAPRPPVPPRGPLPEPAALPQEATDPEQEAVLADFVGLALLVVLDVLVRAERLALVLHDMFAVPFDEVAPIVGRTPAAVRQLASRARRRVQAATPNPDLPRQRAVVDAFLAAARTGDLDALIAVLHPDVVLRAGVIEARGATAVARGALTFAHLSPHALPALLAGRPGFVVTRHDRQIAALAFTVDDGLITDIDVRTALTQDFQVASRQLTPPSPRGCDGRWRLPLRQLLSAVVRDAAATAVTQLS